MVVRAQWFAANVFVEITASVKAAASAAIREDAFVFIVLSLSIHFEVDRQAAKFILPHCGKRLLVCR